MFLAHLLHRAGIDSVVVERRDSAYVEGRVRAGVLERTTTGLLERLGLAGRMHREGSVHTGTNLGSDGALFRVDLADLTQGGSVTVYGQQEVMRDLFDGAEASGMPVMFEALDVTLSGLASAAPAVTWHTHGAARRGA